MDFWKRFCDWLSKLGLWPVIITCLLSVIGVFVAGIVIATWTLSKYINQTSTPQVIVTQGPSSVTDSKSDPINYVSATITSEIPVDLPNIPTGARAAFITSEENVVRYRLDGANPSKIEGHLLMIGDGLTINTRKGITQFKAIALDKSAIIRITYYEAIK